MKIHYFQHVEFEALGSIQTWALANGHTLSATRFYADEPLPDVDHLHWLIVMGGPMNVYETTAYPWLAAEKRFIERAIEEDKVVLGICLGAQLIADVLGARVSRNRCREIGWFPIDLTPQAARSHLFNFLPRRFEVLHWHGDTFDLPHGAVHIARSDGCDHQAFIYGERVIGLQFHLECTPASVQRMIENCGNELTAGLDEHYIQSCIEIMAPADKFQQANAALHQMLNCLSSHD